MIRYSQAEFDRMVHIQGEVEKKLLEYKDNTEAAHVVFALIRTAKKMLALYPDATRADLTEVIVMTLLDARERAPEESRASIIDRLFGDGQRKN